MKQKGSFRNVIRYLLQKGKNGGIIAGFRPFNLNRPSDFSLIVCSFHIVDLHNKVMQMALLCRSIWNVLIERVC